MMGGKISQAHISYAFAAILMLLTLTVFVSCALDGDIQSGKVGSNYKYHELRLASKGAVADFLDQEIGFDILLADGKNAEFALDFLEREPGVYSGKLILSFYLKDQFGEVRDYQWVDYDAFTGSGDHKKGRDYRYNKWFGDGEFNAYLEESLGSIFIYMKLDKSSVADADQLRYLNTASGAIYFRPWKLTDAQKNGFKKGGPTISIGPFVWSSFSAYKAYIPEKPAHCLNISLGPYQCFVGQNISQPGSGYLKLGEFNNFNVSEAFGVNINELDWGKH